MAQVTSKKGNKKVIINYLKFPRIVCALAIYDAIFFGDGPTDERTNKAILGVGLGNTYKLISQCKELNKSKEL